MPRVWRIPSFLQAPLSSLKRGLTVLTDCTNPRTGFPFHVYPASSACLQGARESALSHPSHCLHLIFPAHVHLIACGRPRVYILCIFFAQTSVLTGRPHLPVACFFSKIETARHTDCMLRSYRKSHKSIREATGIHASLDNRVSNHGAHSRRLQRPWRDPQWDIARQPRRTRGGTLPALAG